MISFFFIAVLSTGSERRHDEPFSTAWRLTGRLLLGGDKVTT